MTGTFDGCISLTSIDLSSFENKNEINLGLVFGHFQNLTYIDISSFNYDYKNSHGN